MYYKITSIISTLLLALLLTQNCNAQPDSTEQCPSFVNNPGTNKSYYKQIITVLDSVNDIPIKNATIKYTVHQKTINKGKTTFSGNHSSSIKPGLYTIYISAKKYKPLVINHYLKRRNPTITIYLQPTHKIKDSTIIAQNIVNDIPKKEIKKEVIKTNDTPNNNVDTLNTNTTQLSKLYASNNIVFLVDVSASMKRPYRLPFLKKSVRELLSVLRDIDRISLITYSKTSQLLINSIPATQKDSILNIIDTLTATGVTFGLTGLNEAYKAIQNNYIEGGNNQIIIATDGEFNGPNNSLSDIETYILSHSSQDIILSVIGFEEEAIIKKAMKKMAKTGNGNYIHIDKEKASDSLKDFLIDEIKEQSFIEPIDR